MTNSAESLKQNILEAGIVDVFPVHHAFGQGLHGRKISFNAISDESNLYREWVMATKEKVEDLYTPDLPDALIGVSNGTNRLALSVGKEIGSGILVLATAKRPDSPSKVALISESIQLIDKYKPRTALVLEDVGTRGTNSLSAVMSAICYGLNEVQVLNTWQRSETLALLDEAEVQYDSVIKEILPSYTPEECALSGLCAQGWELVPYKN